MSIRATIRKRTWKTGDATREAWVVDYTASGKRHLKTFSKQAEAKAWLADLLPEIKAGTHVADRDSITVDQAANRWIAACERGRDGGHPLEESTVRHYRQHREHLKSLVGNVKLNALTKARMEALRDDLLARHSRPLARKILTSFKSILLAGGAGPAVYHAARAVKIKAATGRHQEDVTCPEPSEIKAILAQADEFARQPHKSRAKTWRRWRALVNTAVFTGMRQSELRGLRWPSVDLAGQIIAVRERADEVGNLGPCKSRSGRRDIPVPAALVSILKEWKLECPPGDFVFPNWQGNVESGANIYSRCWAPLSVAAGVRKRKLGKDGAMVDTAGEPVWDPKYTFHALRHFHASCLIADGANPREVMEEMGHSSIQITYDVYGHLFQEDVAGRRARADRLAAGLK